MKRLNKNQLFDEVEHLLEYDDMTDDLQLLYDVLGRENTIKLIRELGGTQLYIPRIYSLSNMIEKTYCYFKGNRRRTAAALSMTIKHLGVLIRNNKWRA
jgi:hypothetical protein